MCWTEDTILQERSRRSDLTAVGSDAPVRHLSAGFTRRGCSRRSSRPSTNPCVAGALIPYYICRPGHSMALSRESTSGDCGGMSTKPAEEIRKGSAQKIIPKRHAFRGDTARWQKHRNAAPARTPDLHRAHLKPNIRQTSIISGTASLS